MYGTQVGFLSIREYWHCAFLMFSKCMFWLSFNVNLCALLFTIELKLASFQSKYWKCVFLSFLSAQFRFVLMPSIKIVCLSVQCQTQWTTSQTRHTILTFGIETKQNCALRKLRKSQFQYLDWKEANLSSMLNNKAHRFTLKESQTAHLENIRKTQCQYSNWKESNLSSIHFIPNK